MPRLTDPEKQEVIRFLEADKQLPEEYRFLLFEEYEEVWTGDSSRMSGSPSEPRKTARWN